MRFEIDAALVGELQVLQRYPELFTNLTLSYNSHGTEAYRIEHLRAVAEANPNHDFSTHPPFYERYGELRVSQGGYEDVIRYDEHILPIGEALQSFVERRSLSRFEAVAAV